MTVKLFLYLGLSSKLRFKVFILLNNYVYKKRKIQFSVLSICDITFDHALYLSAEHAFHLT